MSLVFPSKILDQHLVVLGKTGAGKSSALRHIVEHLLAHKKRVCIVDPKGDWWGLKWSADGKAEGFPVIAFGDFKEPKAADVPISEHAGKHVAELIATGNRPCIIGFRGWMTSHMVRFWIDFASTLFNSNSGELYLVGDEFHNFAPKGKIMDPDAGKCLHWSNRIINEGRGLGITCLIASQRPQKVHNDTLTACETLVAMRVIHKADRDAVEDWIEGCGDMQRGKDILQELANMARGEAYVWSPEIGFGPSRLKFPMFSTFDSFAPPQLQKKVGSADWANVDLEEVKSKLAKVIEEQKANDPAELKRTIADLKRKLAEVERKVPEVKQEVITQPIFDASCRQLLEGVEKTCSEVLQRTQERAEDFRLIHIWLKNARARAEKLSLAGPAVAHVAGRPRLRRGPETRPAGDVHSNGHLPIGEKKILRALIQYPDGLAREQLTVLTGYKRSSRDAYIARLKEKQFVATDGEKVMATDEGQAKLPDAEPLPVGQELQDYHRQRLPVGELAILEQLIEAYPKAVERDSLDEATGYKRSSRDAYIARLRAKELLTEPSRGEVRASDQLFSA